MKQILILYILYVVLVLGCEPAENTELLIGEVGIVSGIESKASASTVDENRHYAIKSIISNKYVDREGSGVIVASSDNKDIVSAQFCFVHLGNEIYAIKNILFKNYLNVDNWNTHWIMATSGRVLGSRGKFQCVFLGDRKFALKSLYNNKYVRVHTDDYNRVIADGSGINDSTSFQHEDLDYDAEILIDESSVPTTMISGSTADIRIRVKNLGLKSWSSPFEVLTDYYMSGNQFSFTDGMCGGLYNGPDNSQVWLCDDQTIAPGEQVDFIFKIKAPTYTHRACRLKVVMKSLPLFFGYFGEMQSWNILVYQPTPAPTPTPPQYVLPIYTPPIVYE